MSVRIFVCPSSFGYLRAYSERKMFISSGKIYKCFFLITITAGQSSTQFFPSLLFKNDWTVRDGGSFFSLNIFRKLHHLRFFN